MYGDPWLVNHLIVNSTKLKLSFTESLFSKSFWGCQRDVKILQHTPFPIDVSRWSQPSFVPADMDLSPHVQVDLKPNKKMVGPSLTNQPNNQPRTKSHHHYTKGPQPPHPPGGSRGAEPGRLTIIQKGLVPVLQRESHALYVYIIYIYLVYIYIQGYKVILLYHFVAEVRNLHERNEFNEKSRRIWRNKESGLKGTQWLHCLSSKSYTANERTFIGSFP